MKMRYKLLLIMGVLALASSFIIFADDSEESEASGESGTASNPLTTLSISPYDAYNYYRDTIVYVAVGGTVDITSLYIGSYAWWCTNVTSGYGLELVGPQNGWSVRGTITQAGTITVSMTTSDYHYAPFTMTIQAVQVTNTHTVTFSVVSGSSYGYVSPTSITVADGTTYSASGRTITFSDNQTVTAYLNSPPSGYTYSFNGWSSSSGTITQDKTITCSFSRQSVTPTYTCYLYYNANGGDTSSLPSPNPQTYSGSSTQNHQFTISSTVPTRSGYTFLGWNNGSASATMPDYQPGDTISVPYYASYTLYAIWGHLYTYTAAVSPSNGGTATVNGQQSYQTDDNSGLQLISTPATGFRFVKWTYTINGQTYDLSTSQNYYVDSSPAADVTYTAVFQQYAFTVVLDAGANGGYFELNPESQSTTTRSITVEVGRLYSSASGWQNTVYKLGSNFDGWYTAQSGGTLVDVFTTVPSNPPSRLYAQFTPIDYTVSVVANDSSLGTVSGGGLYSYGDSVTISATPNTGHSFLKWNLINHAGQTVEFSNQATYTFTLDYLLVIPYSSDTLSLTAIFDDDQITITFNPNGGTATEVTRQISRGSAIGTLPTATRSGTTFSGWSMYLENTGTMITPETTFIENTTIYAMYDVVVTYNPNGGVITSGDATQNVTIGQMDYRFPTADKEGYTLEGWYTQRTGGERVYVSTRTISNADHTLWAHWTSQTITVNFDATTNGGVLIGQSSKEVTKGSTFGTLPTAYKENYVFDGWYTNIASGTKITTTSVVAANYPDPMTLYAHYTERSGSQVWWDNNYFNGTIEIAFDFSDSTSMIHNLEIPLLSYDGIEDDADGIDWFSMNGYSISISAGYNRNVTCSITDPNSGVIGYEPYMNGWWTQYILKIDVQSGTISFIGIEATDPRTGAGFTFMDYNEVFEKVIFDISDNVTLMAIQKVYHSDTGTSTNHPHFQVVATTTWLNTYGFVMVDPTLNIYNKFPSYDNLRLNIYSFAYYGDSITINNFTFPMDGSVIEDFWYLPKGSPIYEDEQIVGYTTEDTISYSGITGAVKLNPTLTNIYITWTNIHSDSSVDRVCYLTFVNDNKTINMGNYDIGDLEISFEGVWYFTTALYEPYIGYETEYIMDWDSPFNLDKNAFILVFIGIAIFGFLIMNMIYRPGLLDYLIVGFTGLIAYILL